MSVITHSTNLISDVSQSLETTRNELSRALATPECSGGAKNAERPRLIELHRRITGALSALYGEARDW